MSENPRQRRVVPAGRTAAKPKRRPYTLSPAALEQRRANAPKALAAGALAGKATGPVTEAGKAASSRNGWKHGRFSAVNRQYLGLTAASMPKLFGKPCVTTCPFHPDNPERTEAPCSLVLDGLTQAGGSCLDKSVFVHAASAILDALQSGEMDGMNGVLAGEVAGNLQLLQQIRQEIADKGVVVPQYAVDKSGKVVLDPDTGEKLVLAYRLNPALPSLAHLTDVLKINLPELMATPKARRQLADDEDAAGALQSVFGAIVAKAGRALGSRGKPPIEHNPED